jgi:hypothetical protein
MRHPLLFFFLLFLTCSTFADPTAPTLPSERSRWLDGKQLSREDLKGKVVLLNVWTFGCWNSYRSLPWIVSLQSKFPNLQIIGIHSPEFPQEKDRNRLRETMKQYRVTYPQLLDDDFQFWRSLNNRYWPAFYIVDPRGVLRGSFTGETHAGDTQAERIEKLIHQLTQEARLKP